MSKLRYTTKMPTGQGPELELAIVQETSDTSVSLSIKPNSPSSKLKVFSGGQAMEVISPEQIVFEGATLADVQDLYHLSKTLQALTAQYLENMGTSNK